MSLAKSISNKNEEPRSLRMDIESSENVVEENNFGLRIDGPSESHTRFLSATVSYHQGISSV